MNPITMTAALKRAGKPLPLRDLAVVMGVRWSALRVPVAEMFAAGMLERTRAGTRGGPWSYAADDSHRDGDVVVVEGSGS